MRADAGEDFRAATDIDLQKEKRRQTIGRRQQARIDTSTLGLGNASERTEPTA